MDKSSKVRIAMFEEGRRIKPIQEWDGSFSYPIDGEGDYLGVTLYDVTRPFAAVLCMDRPNRYRLIGDKPIDARQKNEWGGSNWVKLYPWRRKKCTTQKTAATFDKAEGPKPATYETSYVWEHLEPKITLPKVDEEK